MHRQMILHNTLQHLRSSSIVVQSFIRMSLARIRTQIRLYYKQQERHRAALKIQYWMRHALRERTNNAVLLIQSTLRMHLVRKRYGVYSANMFIDEVNTYTMASSRENRYKIGVHLATTMQAYCRRFLVAKDLATRYAAATMIQSLWRGRQARVAVEFRKEMKKRQIKYVLLTPHELAARECSRERVNKSLLNVRISIYLMFE